MSNRKRVARYHKGIACGQKASSALSRRGVLQGTVALSAIALSGCGASASGTGFIPALPSPPPDPLTGSGTHPIFGANQMTRMADALALRTQAAQTQADQVYGTQATNGDEVLFSDYRGSFTKGLPHNSLGEVDELAYQRYLTALDTGENADFEAIPLGGVRKLVSPQAAFRFEMVGLDSHKTFIRPAPTFAGAETAAEMGELYWKALCRDVPFTDFGSNMLVQAAVTDLNTFSAAVGPKVNGQVTTATVFRGETPGDLVGPYISQLLFKDIPYGNGRIEQKYDTQAPGSDFMTDTASWLNIQNGLAPASLVKGAPRYISDPRALSEFVHADYTFQAYLNAALIILGIPNSFDIGNIYNASTTQAAFATLGGPDVLDMVAKAGNLALSGAWYQKWLVHRRARPEKYGGRLHYQIVGTKDYGLHSDIVNSDAVAQTFANWGTYLLPQAFPEGAPLHPSYPAGHATIAGACTTVLKAFFEEELLIPNPVIANSNGTQLLPYSGDLTIGGEINKLANNIALGRDWAGVHYRSDGVDGLQVGEQQAIGLLQDYSLTYREQFDGFTLRKFDGTRVNINNGVVT